jgi:hypothetical protein
MEFVRDHPEYPWNVKGLLLNPNCSLEMYEKNIGTVSLNVWEHIFTQSFVREKEAFIEKRYRDHLSAYRIQQYWNRSLTDPNYALCLKKLEADWLAYSTKTLLT